MWGLFCGVNQITDLEYEALAVAEARKGRGQTWTNPLVGAVIVKHDVIVARGHHDRYGGPHAEVAALAQLPAGITAQGATLVVTLEPCCFQGKTPPCTDRVIAAGITRVVIGQRDPNPRVAGRGIAQLRSAGIAVTVLGVPDDLNPHYRYFYQQGRPWVTLKAALSVDGKLNGPRDTRTRLTGPAAQRDSQHLRATHQAVLIGERTLRIDDPLLTVRAESVVPAPWRVVVVHDADTLPVSRQLWQTAGPVWLLSRTASRRDWPANVHVAVAADWSPAAVLAWLTARGIQSLLVEGGARVLAAFMATPLVDQVVVYLAPLLLGGTGLAIHGPGRGEPLALIGPSVTRLGPDLRLTYGRSEHVYGNH